MNGEHPWDPERLGKLTLVQLQCLINKQPPDVEKPLTNPQEFFDRLAELEAEERDWYAP